MSPHYYGEVCTQAVSGYKLSEHFYSDIKVRQPCSQCDTMYEDGTLSIGRSECRIEVSAERDAAKPMEYRTIERRRIAI